MEFCFIVPDKEKGVLPPSALLEKLRVIGEVKIIGHVGRLSDIDELKAPGDKILGVDPDSFEDFDAESLKDIPGVKAVMSSTTAFDWFKPEVLRTLGITACNVPGFSADAVAEYAIAMAIDVSRKLPLVVKSGWKMDWDEPKPILLKGKRVGIIGLGRIGMRIAQLCAGIGMEVVYWSKNSTDARFKRVGLDELMKTSQLVMPALAVNAETKKIVDRALLDLLRPDAVLVGIGRVKMVWDEEYILEKVKKGELFGYAFEGEGAKPLEEYEGNVLALPAMAWHTQDSLDNLMSVWVENMIAFVNGKPQNVIN